MKKIGRKIIIGITMTLLMTSTVFAAGGWKKNETGWWYATNDAGTTWHANGWQWIDGNNDGTSECYYFDQNGYMLANCTTPDGYTVNADGAWTENGAVQAKAVETNNNQSQKPEKKFYRNVNGTIVYEIERIPYYDYEYGLHGESIKASVAPTALIIRDENGNYVGSKSRVQNYCHPFDGNMRGDGDDVVYLERGKKYSIDAVLSFYIKTMSINSTEREMNLRVESYDSATGVYFTSRNPVKLYPVKKINQDNIDYIQLLDGQDSGPVYFTYDDIVTEPYSGRHRYRYMGIGFHADGFEITDDMPDQGGIYVVGSNIYSDNGDNWTMSDDTLSLSYEVK